MRIFRRKSAKSPVNKMFPTGCKIGFLNRSGVVFGTRKDGYMCVSARDPPGKTGRMPREFYGRNFTAKALRNILLIYFFEPMEGKFMTKANKKSMYDREHQLEEDKLDDLEFFDEGDGLSEAERLKLAWLSMYDHSELSHDEWLRTLDAVVGDVHETVECLDGAFEELYDRADDLEEKVEDLKESLDGTDDILFETREKLDHHKAAIIGLFGLQIVLSVVYFCMGCSVGRNSHGITKKAV